MSFLHVYMAHGIDVYTVYMFWMACMFFLCLHDICVSTSKKEWQVFCSGIFNIFCVVIGYLTILPSFWKYRLFGTLFSGINHEEARGTWTFNCVLITLDCYTTSDFLLPRKLYQKKIFLCWLMATLCRKVIYVANKSKVNFPGTWQSGRSTFALSFFIPPLKWMLWTTITAKDKLYLHAPWLPTFPDPMECSHSYLLVL